MVILLQLVLQSETDPRHFLFEHCCVRLPILVSIAFNPHHNSPNWCAFSDSQYTCKSNVMKIKLYFCAMVFVFAKNICIFILFKCCHCVCSILCELSPPWLKRRCLLALQCLFLTKDRQWFSCVWKTIARIKSILHTNNFSFSPSIHCGDDLPNCRKLLPRLVRKCVSSNTQKNFKEQTIKRWARPSKTSHREHWDLAA